ncbi:hypothetical protein V8E51_008228 [Hyaloscypha variabilis]
MASGARLPLRSLAFTGALALSVVASRMSIRNALLNTFTGPSRVLAALFILANIKNVPFAWHFRVFNAILRHCLFSKPNIPSPIASSTLFLPVITTSHSPFMECDYNLHKSNSTYFSDLDVTRSHLVCALLEPGIEALKNNRRERLVLDKEGKPVAGRWSIMLGGVMSTFKREIGMYQGYEMWSRVLCWDRKWLYVITHFVKKGTVRPSAYILTDGTWFGRRGYKEVHGKKSVEVDEKAIFASAISKYVVKLGRLTIHPEVSLAASGLLPSRPGGWATMTGPSGESTPETLDVEKEETPESSSSSSSPDEWDWRRIDAQNAKGLKFVEHFAALDGLHDEFSGSQTPALGKYRDFLW